MNRIYQGRVTSAEIFDEQEQKQPLTEQKWLKVLWEHHALFQDAINYYIVALLGMATSADNALKEHRDLLAEKDENGKPTENYIWTRFRRGGITRTGLLDSLSRTINLNKKNPEPKDYFRAILHEDCPDADTSTQEVLDLALRELLKSMSERGRNVIRETGREMLPRFCNPEYIGNYPYSATGREGKKGEQRLHTELHDLENDQLTEFAREVELGWAAKLNTVKLPFQGEEAKDRLRKAANHFWVFGGQDESQPKKAVRDFLKEQRQQCDTESELREIIEEIESMPNEEIPDIPRNNRASRDKTGAVLLFKYFPRRFTWNLLKIVFPRKEISDRISEDPVGKGARELGDDPIKLARGSRGYVFRAFTSFGQFGSQNGMQPLWKEFDIAAFKEALKTLYQIVDKKEERKRELDEFQKKLDCMNNKREWVASENDDDAPPRLAGDKRVTRLEKILKEDLARESDMADGDVREYGFRPRTVREFVGLRERWRRMVKVGEVYTASKKQELLAKLKEYQKDKATSIGSVTLFEKLLERKNWIIWQEQTEETMMNWREGTTRELELDFADNPLAALVDKRQLERKIEQLEKPVRLTPADAVSSPRHYCFSDDDTFDNSDSGHQRDTQSVKVSVAVKIDGKFQERKIELRYSAPRLVRDGLDQSEGGKLGQSEGLGSPFLQPMMKGLKEKPSEQKGNLAVSLMPKREHRIGAWRFLLNFAPEIDTQALVAKLRKKELWEKQFVGVRNKNIYLRWPSLIDGASTPPQGWWWERSASGFTCLSVDLGQRVAGAFAIADVRPDQQDRERISRYIGSTGTDSSPKLWYATIVKQGIFRLAGEDKRVPYDGRWKQEKSGKRGRLNCSEEQNEARDICERLGFDPSENLNDGDNRKSFPEINDQLLRIFSRAKWRLQRLQSLSWRLSSADYAVQACQEIEKSDELRDLLGLEKSNDKDALRYAVRSALDDLRCGLPKILEKIANRVLPLHDSVWVWGKHPNSSSGKESYVLQRRKLNDSEVVSRKIRGQRGVSFWRIEQLERLRRLTQGLNRSLTQTQGEKPNLGRATRGEEWPDPCPEILDKLERIKEQRVNQTAHMILAEALGVRLRGKKNGGTNIAKRHIHGEYEQHGDPVDFIVLEDLSRYRTSQDRTRRENSRLMQWSHRAILEKLKELSELYGIPIVEVNASYSSRFCARSGAPGFRAVEYSPLQKPFWLKRDKQSDESRRLLKIFDTLNKINAGRKEAGKPLRTLLAPLHGGPLFISAGKVPYIRQADINAAINLVLRAIAAPDCLDVHVRIRTHVDENGQVIRPLKESKFERARWGENNPQIKFSASPPASFKKQRYQNFFVDKQQVAEYGRADIDGSDIQVSSSIGIWGTIKNLQWKIIKQLNEDMLGKWGFGSADMDFLDEDLP